MAKTVGSDTVGSDTAGAGPTGAQAVDAEDIRPHVARPQGNFGAWLFAAVLAAAGGGIFYAMELHRMALSEPSLTDPVSQSDAVIAAPPPLVVPPDQAGGSYPVAAPHSAFPTPATINRPGPARVAFQPYVPGPGNRANGFGAGQSPPLSSPPVAPAFAYQAPPVPTVTRPGDDKKANARITADHLANPSTTVPQGSVIQAVMETALDSTRAGFARAIVSRDVFGFDGSRVLIPKGSKLFGEYQSDVSLGQKRALIQWHRLTLPDGTIMDIDSPSADPLGRAGVKGKVNTHFLQRFGGAILQSALDLGVQAATRRVGGNTVILGLPGASTQANTIQSPADIKPTLKIAQGASVSVFVAHDLDFTDTGPSAY